MWEFPYRVLKGKCELWISETSAGISKKFRSIFYKHHILLYFKPANTLRQKLVHCKDKTTRHKQRYVVYLVSVQPRLQKCVHWGEKTTTAFTNALLKNWLCFYSIDTVKSNYRKWLYSTLQYLTVEIQHCFEKLQQAVLAFPVIFWKDTVYVQYCYSNLNYSKMLFLEITARFCKINDVLHIYSITLVFPDTLSFFI